VINPIICRINEVLFRQVNKHIHKASVFTAIVLLIISASWSASSKADSFTITGAETTQNGGNTLNGDDTLTITATGSITTTGASEHAVSETGSNNTVLNEGEITTSGKSSASIDSRGANAMITNNSTITNTGSFNSSSPADEPEGIFSSGLNAVITNNGDIITTGVLSDGIRSFGADALINNNGNIYTSAGIAHGIRANGNNAVITNSGDITTSGGGLGILSSTVIGGGDNVTIRNSGSITTTFVLADGIFSNGADATITNSGSITITGDNADGIFSSGADAVITNSGSITTAGSNANGIVSFGADATITTSGNITTTMMGDGIVSVGDNVTITTSGNITAAGSDADGIVSLGNNATITNSNSGTITTSADGIRSFGADATITTSGSITTSGDFADGIRSYGGNATITNSGSIQVSGNGAIGVSLGSLAADSLTNSGSIVATSSATQAIVGGTGSNTVNLQTGSIITGHIALGNGNDALTVEGDSTVTGNINMGTGTDAININSGRLTLNGTITNSDTNVNTGGTLAGNATTANLFVNGGSVAPGNSIGTINVTGNVDFTGGGNYDVEVNAAGASDLINATGTATLTSGVVNIKPEAGNYAESTDYTLLTAVGGLGGTTFSDMTMTDLAFLSSTLSYDANNVFLNLAVDFTGLSNLSPNEQAVNQTLATLHANNATGLDALFGQLFTLDSEAGKQALSSLSGVQHTHSAVVINNVAQQFQQLLLQRAYHGANTLLGLNGFTNFNPLQGHLLADNSTNWQTAETDTSSLVSARGWWMQGFGGFGDIEDTSNATGADYDTQGVAVGLDTEWRDVSVGAAFSYASSDVEPVAGAGDIDSFQLGSYLGWQREAWYVNAALGMGYHQSESNRTIVVGATVNTAEADYDSYHVSTAMEVGHAVAINNATTLTPYVGVNYTHTHRESFTESGAGTANLSVDDEDEDSLRTALGLRLSHELNTGDDKRLTPYVDVAYVREMMDSTSRLDAGFATVPTATFRIDGSELDRDRVRLGVGMRGQLNENTTLNVGYNGEFADSDDNHSFAATINFVW
jgi:outer membrane autotransporter protein